MDLLQELLSHTCLPSHIQLAPAHMAYHNHHSRRHNSLHRPFAHWVAGSPRKTADTWISLVKKHFQVLEVQVASYFQEDKEWGIKWLLAGTTTLSLYNANDADGGPRALALCVTHVPCNHHVVMKARVLKTIKNHVLIHQRQLF